MGTYTLEAYVARYIADLQIIAWAETVGHQSPGQRFAQLQGNVQAGVLQQTYEAHHSTLVQQGTISFAADFGPPPPPVQAVGQLGPVVVSNKRYETIGAGALRRYINRSFDYRYEFALDTDLTTNPSAWI